jgi:hypothetical protein
VKKLVASLGTLVLAMAGMAAVAHAQQAQTQPGVARISLIHGDVSMQRADSGDWVAATVNTPLLNGDTISTGPNSRAEVQLDFANVLRLASNTSVKIATLNSDRIQVQVAQGLANFEVLYQDKAQAEIDTPNVAVHPLGNGSYRIQVDSSNQSMVTVRQGEADVSTPQGSTRVESGQLITVQGVNNPQYQTTNAAPADSWDQWNSQRDRVIADASSWHHTDRYYTGAQDLDAYGRWTYVPDYGQVWTPYAYAGWAPYRDGRWVWEPFYGWTWVSYEPWGWAPYHYGRWFVYAGNWCWWPGPVAVYPAYYPVWAPAYVSFFGFGYAGAGFSFGFGFGNIGWLPIGPADPYYPWWGYGRGLNVIRFSDYRYRRHDWDHDHGWGPLYRGRGGYSNFDHVMTDRHLRGGASWMAADKFGHAPVPRQRGMMDGAQFRNAQMFNGRVPVVPTRESLQPTNRAPNPASYRHGLVNDRHFFMKGRPAANPAPFREQQAQMQRVVRDFRNPKAGGFNNQGRQAPAQRSFANRDGAPSRAATGTGAGRPAQDSNGSQSFGRPANVRQAPAQRASTPVSAMRGGSQSSPRTGWHSFGSAVPSNRGNGSWAEQSGQNSSGRTGGSASPAQRGRPQAGPAQRQGGWSVFTPSSRQSQPAPAQRQGGSRGFTPSPRQSQPAQGQNWKVFTPKSEQPRNSPPARGQQSAPAQRQGGFRPFTQSSQPSSQGGGWRQSGRPPLNLRQPIVERRQGAPRNNGPSGYSNYGRGGYGNSGGGRAPAYRAPQGNSGGRGGYAPRSGGGSRGARGGSTPRGGSRGGGGHPGGRPHH